MHNGIALAGIIFGIMGCIILVAECVQMFRAISASHWPSVNGEIEFSGVEKGYDYNGQLNSRRVVFKPSIQYRYQFAGHVHHGDRLGFVGIVSSSFNAASRTAARFSPRETVRVFVSPKDPADAVLEVGLKSGHYIGLAIGIALVAFGAATFIVYPGAWASAWAALVAHIH